MYVCVCAYVCACIQMCVCTCVYVPVCMSVYVDVEHIRCAIKCDFGLCNV